MQTNDKYLIVLSMFDKNIWNHWTAWELMINIKNNYKCSIRIFETIELREN